MRQPKYYVVLGIIAACVCLTTAQARMTTMVVGGQITTAAAACADSSCTGFTVCQNFEDAGYDNSESWTESGTVSEDNTTGPLRGSQDLILTSAGGGASYSQRNFGSTLTEMYGHFMVNISDVPTGNDAYLTLIRNAGGTGYGAVYVRTAANGTTFRLESGGAACNSSATYSADTTYHVWFHLKNDGTGDLQFGTSADSASALGSCTIASGGTTESFRYLDLRLSGATNASLVAQYDQVLVKTTAIGAVCTP